MTELVSDLIDELKEIHRQLGLREDEREFDPADELEKIIVDIGDERQKTADGYPVNRHSRVYYYSKHSSDGAPSIGSPCLRNGVYCSFYGPDTPIFHKRENVDAYIRSLGQKTYQEREDEKKK